MRFRLESADLRTLAAIGFGSLASIWPAGTYLAISSILLLLCLRAPGLGPLIVIVAKPIVDTSWNVKPAILGAQLNLQSLVGLFAPIGIVAGLALKRVVPKIPRSLALAIVAYASFTMLGVLRSPHRGAALTDAIKYLAPVSFLFAGAYAARSGLPVGTVAAALASYGLVPTLLGVLEGTGVIQTGGEIGDPTSGVYRVRGLYYHPLDISTRCAVALPFGLYLLDATRHTSRGALNLLWTGALAIGSVMTFVRASIFIAVAQLLHFLVGTKRVVAAILIAATVPITVAAVGPLRMVAMDAYMQVTQGSVLELGSGRGIIFAAQIGGYVSASVAERCVGRGLHTVQDVIVEYAPAMGEGFARAYERGEAVPAHNQYLRVLTETGAFGLLALCWMLWAIIRAVLGPGREGTSAERSAFALAVNAVVLALLIYGLTTTPLDSPHLAIPMWFAVGAVIGYSK